MNNTTQARSWQNYRNVNILMTTLIALHCCDSPQYLLLRPRTRTWDVPILRRLPLFFFCSLPKTVAEKILLKPAPLSSLVIHIVHLYHLSYKKSINDSILARKTSDLYFPLIYAILSSINISRKEGISMNETIQTMVTRRSIRSYKPDMIPEEYLEQILKAGTCAASGRGMQSPVIVAVTDKETRDKLSRMNATIMGTDTDPFYGAPIVLVVLADKNRPTYLYDGSLVIGNLMNAAHALGIGSCWIHRAKEEFESEEGKSLLKKWGVEGDYEGIGHCILGYAEEPLPENKPRKENYIYYVK